MALDWHNLVNYHNNIHSFDYQQHLQFHNHAETEELCFDFDSNPPTIFDINDILVDPIQQQLDHDLYQVNDMKSNVCDFNSSMIIPCIDSSPPMYLSTEDFFPCTFQEEFYDNLFNGFMPELVFEPSLIPQWGKMEDPSVQNVANYHQVQHHILNDTKCDYNGDCDNNNGNVVMAKSITAQSKAARERRRKISEKTQELGKLVPGGTKMNTAEMFAAAFKYVKFLQAQLGLLQSMKTINQEDENAIKHNEHLSILASDVIQEKLYTKEKCLVPIDVLPMIQQHLDFQTDIIH